MNVYQKLMQARIDLHAMPIKKSGENTFAKYRYMELGDFLIPTQKIFAQLGLCGVVSFSADVASLTITDVDTEKQIVITSPMGSAALKGCHEVQNIGAVQTYQRRYLWVTAMEIVEHDAIDASAGKADTPKALDAPATPAKTPDIAAILRGITGAATMEVLRANHEAAVSMLDESHHPAVIKATKTRKAELTNLKANA